VFTLSSADLQLVHGSPTAARSGGAAALRLAWCSIKISADCVAVNVHVGQGRQGRSTALQYAAPGERSVPNHSHPEAAPETDDGAWLRTLHCTGAAMQEKRVPSTHPCVPLGLNAPFSCAGNSTKVQTQSTSGARIALQTKFANATHPPNEGNTRFGRSRLTVQSPIAKSEGNELPNASRVPRAWCQGTALFAGTPGGANGTLI